MLKEALAISGGRAWFAPAGIEDEAGAEPQDEMLYAAVRKIEETEGKFDLIPVSYTHLHQLGSYKYRTIGRAYTLGDLKTMNKEEVSDLEKLVRYAGLDCVDVYKRQK